MVTVWFGPKLTWLNSTSLGWNVLFHCKMDMFSLFYFAAEILGSGNDIQIFRLKNVPGLSCVCIFLALIESLEPFIFLLVVQSFIIIFLYVKAALVETLEMWVWIINFLQLWIRVAFLCLKMASVSVILDEIRFIEVIASIYLLLFMLLERLILYFIVVEFFLVIKNFWLFLNILFLAFKEVIWVVFFDNITSFRNRCFWLLVGVWRVSFYFPVYSHRNWWPIIVVKICLLVNLNSFVMFILVAIWHNRFWRSLVLSWLAIFMIYCRNFWYFWVFLLINSSESLYFLIFCFYFWLFFINIE